MGNSITYKLLSLITIAFVVSAVCVLLMADKQLHQIMDDSQLAVYVEKIETIKGVLKRSNERLRKTGLVETYFEDFRDSTVDGLRNIYYDEPGLVVYPFIIEKEGVIIMHPVYPAGDFAPPEIMNGIASSRQDDGSGEFNYVWLGQDKWCVYQDVPEWDWVTGYIIPLDVKYRDARSFLVRLAYILLGITLMVLVALSFIVSRFIRPIGRLTRVATAMAAGDLKQHVEVNSSDEIGTLAKSFNNMRASIAQKITQLQQEIEERQKIQADLANEKEQLAVTLRSIADGVITTDTGGKIVLINKVAEDLTGWANEEAVGQPLENVFNVVNEHNGEKCEELLSRVIKTGQIVGLNIHIRLISKNGDRRSIADSGAPILDADNNIIGMVLVFRDITDQLKTEKELLKIKKLESIGVLAGGIAHDFNNILAAILGNISLTLLDKKLSDSARKRLTEAEKASVRARKLTQQLLTFSKGGEPVKETATLGDIIRDSANFVLHGDKVACYFDIPDDLWLVNIDKGQIGQVIQNIVINGAHAMPEGGKINIACENIATPADDLTPYVQGDKLVGIYIRDNGSGMAENVLEKIFDPYFSTKDDGSGLGLAICQSIINKHNGYIAVESSVGLGTSFSIYLPASDTAVHVKKENVDLTDKTVSNLKVLVMDDEEIVQDVIKAMLVVLGHEVVLSAGGRQAVGKYQQSVDSGRPFDLIIMDLTIPGGMGGKDAARQVLKINADAKIIVSSGYSNDPIMANYSDYGFCAAIVKPFKLHELAVTINRFF